MPAYTSNQGTEILSNYRSVLGPKLSESLRDKIVEDVMRFPTQERRKARLTKLIQKMDRIGVNHSDVVSLLKKLRAQGATFPPGYLKELMGLLKNNYIMGKSRKRRVKKGRQTRRY